MDIELYVYDLTHGMARTMSRQFLGIQIDAVYHTSLVFGSIEYFFGAGVQTCRPGLSHHGQPMERVKMGTTHLPPDTISEYLESLKEVYTPESYDLFAHNCNNFTNDFGMFLVGKGIPAHITGLPKRVLDTPFGQMLKPQLDASMRGVTQAPVPEQNLPRSNGVVKPNAVESPKKIEQAARWGNVINVTSLSILELHLKEASDTAATIFFTSSTCAPCKIAYPAFDTLAEQHSNALFVKIDMNTARDVASKYQIRATPTFMTFSKGTKQDEWSGADPSRLKTQVEQVMEQTFPPHPHSRVNAPGLQYGSMKPVTFVKVPPLNKLMEKLGAAGQTQEFASLQSFIEKRSQNAMEAPLPNLQSISKTFHAKVLALPLEVRFAAVDLLRCSMVDPRVSGFFAADSPSTVCSLIQQVDKEDCPHNLRLVTIHLACNLFTSPLYVKEILREGNELLPLLVQLVTKSLLDNSHPTTRVAAGSLAFNMAVANYRVRRESNVESFHESEQVELAASLVETISTEENVDASKAMLLALGYLVYFAPQDGELMDLCQALDAAGTVRAVNGNAVLAKEVGLIL